MKRSGIHDSMACWFWCHWQIFLVQTWSSAGLGTQYSTC
jgi:hypothetical protein